MVDESPLSEDGIESAHTDYAGNFTTSDDYGTDIDGVKTYDLALNGSTMGTGMYALDDTTLQVL